MGRKQLISKILVGDHVRHVRRPVLDIGIGALVVAGEAPVLVDVNEGILERIEIDRHPVGVTREILRISRPPITEAARVVRRDRGVIGLHTVAGPELVDEVHRINLVPVFKQTAEYVRNLRRYNLVGDHLADLDLVVEIEVQHFEVAKR